VLAVPLSHHGLDPRIETENRQNSGQFSRKEDWMKKRKNSELTIEFKRAAVALMAPGVKVSALARELGVCRQRLYEWREALRLGDDQLRRPGRPKRSVEPPAQADDLAGAQKRVAELERRLGQQQLELDFFKQALRQVEALRRPNNGPGATASTPSSKR
jgi:transposase